MAEDPTKPPLPSEAIPSIPQRNSNADPPAPWVWAGLWRALGLDPNVDYAAARLAAVEQQRQQLWQDRQGRREDIDAAIERGERPSERATVADSTTDRGRFSPGDLVVLISCALFAEPFCHAAADAFLHEHYDKAALGFAIGLPPGLAGGTFHWWKTYLGTAARRTAVPVAMALGVVGIISAFTYIAGPEIYRRATIPIEVPVATGFTQQQVDDKISRAVSNLNLQVTEANRQRDAAQREANALRQQIQNAPASQVNLDTPRVYTRLTIPEIRAIYENRTPLQGDILFADEAGKWIDTDGKIMNVFSTGTVILRKDDKGISCVFEKSWWPKLGVLRQDDDIKITGKLLPSQNPSMISLVLCELRG